MNIYNKRLNFISSGTSPCAPTNMNWLSYQNFATINSWLDCLAVSFPHKTEVREIGRSFEGRPLKVVRIGDGDTSKPAVFIDGGIHARLVPRFMRNIHCFII